MSSKNSAYEVLNDFFTRHEDEVVEIGILPPGIQPEDGDLTLQDGSNIGIPKKVLATAFLKAREMFFENVKTDGISSQIAFETTRVMLLFDPEHITAANFRKRRILGFKEESSGHGKDAFSKAADQEFVFLDSILTSPLHRQSKSPTLWYHRTWLMDMLLPIKLELQPGILLFNFYRAELEAVCKAGEQHPKNYYAWQYARRLVPMFTSLIVEKYHNLGKRWNLSFMASTELFIESWCEKHPSDISGWSFLIFLLSGDGLKSELVEKVIKYAKELQWERESLWVFVRTALADTIREDKRAAAMEMLEDMAKEQSRSSSQTEGKDIPECQAAKTLQWIRRYGTPISTS